MSQDIRKDAMKIAQWHAPNWDQLSAIEQKNRIDAEIAKTPPLAKDHVRYYHGGAPPTPDEVSAQQGAEVNDPHGTPGTRHFSPDPAYAAGYADKSDESVSYLDVPTSDPNARKAYEDEDWMTPGQNPYMNTVLPIAGMKVHPSLPAKKATPTTELDTGSQTELQLDEVRDVPPEATQEADQPGDAGDGAGADPTEQGSLLEDDKDEEAEKLKGLQKKLEPIAQDADMAAGGPLIQAINALSARLAALEKTIGEVQQRDSEGQGSSQPGQNGNDLFGQQNAPQGQGGNGELLSHVADWKDSQLSAAMAGGQAGQSGQDQSGQPNVPQGEPGTPSLAELGGGISGITHRDALEAAKNQTPGWDKLSEKDQKAKVIAELHGMRASTYGLSPQHQKLFALERAGADPTIMAEAKANQAKLDKLQEHTAQEERLSAEHDIARVGREKTGHFWNMFGHITGFRLPGMIHNWMSRSASLDEKEDRAQQRLGNIDDRIDASQRGQDWAERPTPPPLDLALERNFQEDMTEGANNPPPGTLSPEDAEDVFGDVLGGGEEPDAPEIGQAPPLPEVVTNQNRTGEIAPEDAQNSSDGIDDVLGTEEPDTPELGKPPHPDEAKSGSNNLTPQLPGEQATPEIGQPLLGSSESPFSAPPPLVPSLPSQGTPSARPAPSPGRASINTQLGTPPRTSSMDRLSSGDSEDPDTPEIGQPPQPQPTTGEGEAGSTNLTPQRASSSKSNVHAGDDSIVSALAGGGAGGADKVDDLVKAIYDLIDEMKEQKSGTATPGPQENGDFVPGGPTPMAQQAKGKTSPPEVRGDRTSVPAVRDGGGIMPGTLAILRGRGA